MIRTVLFDLGNVLVNFSHDQMCDQIGNVCDRPGDDVREFLFDGDLQGQFERGEISQDEFHEKFTNWANRPIDADELFEAASDIFVSNDGIDRILAEIKAQGIRLVLLSNTSVAHFEFVMQRFDVLQEFDDYVVSYRVGALKPDPAIFEAALAAIECEAGESFYTDDIEENIEAGRGHGLQAEVFRGADTLIQQLKQRGLALRMADRS